MPALLTTVKPCQDEEKSEDKDKRPKHNQVLGKAGRRKNVRDNSTSLRGKAEIEKEV